MPLKINGTFDIECGNWTDFVVGGLYDGQNFTWERNEQTYFTNILNFQGCLWGHNAGRYDTLWFLHCLQKAGRTDYRVGLQGSRVLYLRVGKLVLLDSFALIPMSLDSAGGMVGSAKTKLPFGFEEINPRMGAENFAILVDYLNQDCVLLYRVLQYLQAYADENKLILKQTVGSSAWNSAKAELELSAIEPAWQIPEWKFTRRGYYGGRTEVFKTESDKGYRYDRNSSYPAALVQTPLPTGPRKFVGERYAGQAYKKGYEGVYKALVKILPKNNFPPLPHKVKDKTRTERLIFPHGDVLGFWCGNELRYSEQQGVEIKQILSANVWRHSATVLAPWCERVWHLRKNAETPALGRWLKWLLNSLTGKLGERADKALVVVDPPIQKVKSCDGPKKFFHETGLCPGVYCCNHRCIKRCKRWDTLDMTLKLWSRPIWFIPKNSFPHWSGYLTASARISLHEKLIESGTGATYCDTDSVYSERPIRSGIGSGLGEWKLEGDYLDWRALAPKLYRYADSSGLQTVKGKGFPKLDSVGFENLAKGEKVDLGEYPATFKTGLKGDGVWSRRAIKKQLHPVKGLVGARGQNVGPETFALTIRQFTEIVQRKDEGGEG
jgi:hypothetical protein